jgi:hypothetical protein
MAAVPSGLLVKLSPAGRDPDSVRAGAGYPVAVMARLRVTPTSAAASGIFLSPGARVTVRVKAWVAGHRVRPGR